MDKLYFRSLTDPEVAVAATTWPSPWAFPPTSARSPCPTTASATKDELDKNLGTIAHSDSRFEFKAAQAEAAADSEPGEAKGLDDLTGCGHHRPVRRRLLYSAFARWARGARRLRAIGSDETWAWESDSIDGYDIKPAERAEHGTDVIVYLKDDTPPTSPSAPSPASTAHPAHQALQQLRALSPSRWK